MRFDPPFLDAIRQRIPVSRLVGKSVALKRQGREWAGLSPFQKEKTPSFFVNDEKQFYHCFSSGQHGDIFTWLMETEGLSFPEAVERLAHEAGVPLPAQDPQAAKVIARSRSLNDVMDAASHYFRAALASPRGAEARAYLDGRGLSPEDWAHFEIGFAPDARTGLKDHLLKSGAPLGDLAAAGLVITPDDGGAPYDRFRDRIMFPIRDAQGRMIAFGGRALSKSARAKYLNSPETVLFHKGDVLYRYREARKALTERARTDRAASTPPPPGGIIVAEGYMDVIALARAGFSHAAAPLGTAITEAQLDLLWRAGPEPILCFDGDAAGLRAAHRAMDRALPHIRPGRTIRVALMPAGQDPDDVLRASGPKAMAEILDAALALDDMVWRREHAAGPVDTPERRAGLRQRLVAAAGLIEDETVQSEFRRALLDRYYAAFRAPPRPARGKTAGGKDGGGRWSPAPQGPTPEAQSRASGLAVAARRRDTARLLRVLIQRPALIEHCAETLAELTILDDDLAQIRDALIAHAAAEDTFLVQGEITDGVDKALPPRQLPVLTGLTAANDLMADPSASAIPFAGDDRPDAEAATLWMQEAGGLLTVGSLGIEHDELADRVKAARARGDRTEMARALAGLAALRRSGGGAA